MFKAEENKPKEKPKTFQYYKTALIDASKTGAIYDSDILGLIGTCNKKNAFEGSKIILNLMYSGILEKTPSSLRLLDTLPDNFLSYYNWAYKATADAPLARKQLISLLNTIPSLIDDSFAKYAWLATFSNQRVAVRALGDYVKNEEGNLADILTLLGDTKHIPDMADLEAAKLEAAKPIPDKADFDYVKEDLLTLLQSSNLNEAKLALKALESIDYTAHPQEFEKVQNSLLAMLDEESLPKQIQTLVDQSKLLPPKFERMMAKADKMLQEAVSHTSDIDEAKMQIELLLAYLNTNKTFASTAYEGEDSPAKRLYDLVEKYASILQDTYSKPTDAEWEFLIDFVPKVNRQLKELDRSLLKPEEVEQNAGNKSTPKIKGKFVPGGKNPNVTPIPVPIDNLKRRWEHDDFLKFPGETKLTTDYQSLYNFAVNAPNPLFSESEEEQVNSLSNFWHVAYALGSSISSSEKEELRKQAENSQDKEFLRRRLSEVMPDFYKYEYLLDSGNWDQLAGHIPQNSGLLPVPPDLQKGILGKYKKISINLRQVPGLFSFNFTDQTVPKALDEAEKDDKFVVMFGQAFPGTKGTLGGVFGDSGWGFGTTLGIGVSQEVGYEITDYAGVLSISSKSTIIGILNGASALPACISKVSEAISGNIDASTLIKVANAMGYTYINGILGGPGPWEVSEPIARNIIDFLNSERYHSQDVEKIDSPPKYHPQATFDMPLYIVGGSPWLRFGIRPMMGVGSYLSTKKDKTTGEISPDSKFGLTNLALRGVYGDDVIEKAFGSESRSLTGIGGSLKADLYWDRTVSGGWSKPFGSLRAAASPSILAPKSWSESKWTAWIVDSKVEFGIETGGRPTVGLWLFPETFFGTPEWHMSAMLRADPISMQMNNISFKTGREFTLPEQHLLDFFLQVDWNKIEKTPKYRIGVDLRW